MLSASDWTHDDPTCLYAQVTAQDDGRNFMYDASCELNGSSWSRAPRRAVDMMGLNNRGLPVRRALGDDPAPEPAADPAPGLDVAPPPTPSIWGPLLMYGIPGAIFGGLTLGGTAAWAFHAHDPSKSALKPALILGIGGAIAGALSLILVAATANEGGALFAAGVALAR
jgi:hypothetical protein